MSLFDHLVGGGQQLRRNCETLANTGAYPLDENAATFDRHAPTLNFNWYPRSQILGCPFVWFRSSQAHVEPTLVQCRCVQGVARCLGEPLDDRCRRCLRSKQGGPSVCVEATDSR